MIPFVTFQVKSFYIIRENAFIGMIESNNHPVAVIIYAQYILIKGFIDI